MLEYINKLIEYIKNHKTWNQRDKTHVLNKIESIVTDLNDLNLKYQLTTFKSDLKTQKKDFNKLVLLFLNELRQKLICGGYDQVLYDHKNKMQLLKLNQVAKHDYNKLSLQSKFIMFSTTVSSGALVLLLNYYLNNIKLLNFYPNLLLPMSLGFLFLSGLVGIIAYLIINQQLNSTEEQLTYYYDNEWIGDREMLESATGDYKSYIELTFKFTNICKLSSICLHIVLFFSAIGINIKFLLDLLNSSSAQILGPQ